MIAHPQFLDPVTGHSSSFVPGYRSDVGGNTLAYKSFHPSATVALISRCTDGRDAISWLTDPVPHGLAGEPVTFLWIAGYASGTSGADRTYELLIDGAPACTLTTTSRDTPDGWRVRSSDGVELAFQRQWSDWAADHFGYMWLTVPGGRVAPGQQLRLTVVGEAAGNNDWIAVFKFTCEQTIHLVAQPALKRNGEAGTQIIQAALNFTGVKGSVSLLTDTGERHESQVVFGHNVLHLEVPSVDAPVEKRVTVAVDGQVVKEETLTLRPVRLREIYLLPHSHNDIGYSDLQSDVLKKQFTNIEDALELIRRTADYPKGSRFKWNLEIMWPVDCWLAQASPQMQEAFAGAIRSGSIGIDALYGNMLTGISHPEALLRMTECAREIAGRFGVPVLSAMSGDIPGFIWGMVPALAHAGIKYFASGPNYQPFLPDNGDRVGHSNRAWSDRPFIWISPSGEEKILFWMAGKGYSWFHEWIIGKARPGIAHHVYDYMRELEESRYRYDVVQLHYTVGADNGPVDPDLPDFVRRWNAEHVSPRFVVATTAEMFKELEKRHGDLIPAFSGDLTPYWEDGTLSTLHELGLARQASERLVQAECLRAFHKVSPPTAADVSGAWKNVVLFNEHTWGAFNSVTNPDSAFAKKQWEVKRQFAIDADRQSKSIMHDALSGIVSTPVASAYDVINTNSWARSDVVILLPSQSKGVQCVTDDEGNPVLAQRMTNGSLAWLAKEVPPFAARRYFLSDGPVVGEAGTGTHARLLFNGTLEIVVDEQSGGIASLRDLPSGREFVNRESGYLLGEYLYVPGRDPGKVQRVTSSKVLPGDAGPLIRSVVIESEAPGCKWLQREVRLYAGIDRVDVILHVNKIRMREKESVHCAFPLAVPGGQFRLDGGSCCVRPEIDQLPGSCKDFMYAQRWVDVSNAEWGCTWATRESPLVEIGDMTNEQPVHDGYRAWKEKQDASTTFFSYLMNNYWHTNYKADQEGETEVHYSLRPHATFSARDAYRFGIEWTQPLLLVPAVEERMLDVPLFALESADVVITSLAPSRDGRALMVRLLNLGGGARDIMIVWGSFHPSALFLSNLAEERLRKVTFPFSVAPWGAITLRCEV